MYLLDANAWIALFRRKSDKVLDELERHPDSEVALCPVVLAELWYGACRSAPAYRAENQRMVEDLRAKYVSVPLDDAAALDSGELRAYLAALGQPIGPYDLLIAAIARTHDLTLVTRNQSEFSRVPRLKIENWQDS
jgi:tRNA(fMet)-specific endonuclease VapC